MNNLLADVPSQSAQELITVLAEGRNVRIERIVSTGQISPEGFWYDQEEHEWIVLLKGEAKLLFESETAPNTLRPGDCINIPAHQKHRIEWTSTTEATVWLAVFFVRDN